MFEENCQFLRALLVQCHLPALVAVLLRVYGRLCCREELWRNGYSAAENREEGPVRHVWSNIQANATVLSQLPTAALSAWLIEEIQKNRSSVALFLIAYLRLGLNMTRFDQL